MRRQASLMLWNPELDPGMAPEVFDYPARCVISHRSPMVRSMHRGLILEVGMAQHGLRGRTCL